MGTEENNTQYITGILRFNICSFDYTLGTAAVHNVIFHVIGARPYIFMYHEARGFDPCIGKVPWSRKWQPTPVFLLEIPWTEELGGLQPIRSQRVGHDWACPAHEASMGYESVKGSRGPPESSLPNSMDLYVLCMHICSVVSDSLRSHGL